MPGVSTLLVQLEVPLIITCHNEYTYVEVLRIMLCFYFLISFPYNYNLPCENLVILVTSVYIYIYRFLKFYLVVVILSLKINERKMQKSNNKSALHAYMLNLKDLFFWVCWGCSRKAFYKLIRIIFKPSFVCWCSPSDFFCYHEHSDFFCYHWSPGWLSNLGHIWTPLLFF